MIIAKKRTELNTIEHNRAPVSIDQPGTLNMAENSG
jgi:hypothetical protein